VNRQLDTDRPGGDKSGGEKSLDHGKLADAVPAIAGYTPVKGSARKAQRALLI
jgi:hypothetical protein